MNGNPQSSSHFDLKQYAIDQVEDGIYWCDDQARIMEVNDGACRMVGYTREELKSMAVSQLNPNYPIEKWPMHWEMLRKQGSATIETLHRHKDGHLINVEVTANLIIFNGQEIHCAFVRDVTKRKLAEKALYESQAILSGIVNNTPDIIVVKDKEGRYQLINDAAERLMGKPREAIIGHDCISIFPTDQARKAMELDARVIDSGQTLTFEETLTVRGSHYTLLTTKGPMRDQTGAIIGTFSIAHDITERKQAEENLLLTQFASDNSPDQIFWTDERARICYANKAACRDHGYTKDELLAMTISDLDPNFPLEAWPSHWKELKQKGNISLETTHQRKDGSIFPVEVSANFVSFGGKELNIGYTRDITKRKQADAELRVAASFFESQESLLITDADGVILRINKAFTENTGYTFNDVMGQTPRLFKSGRHDAEFYRKMWEAITQAGTWQGEVWDRRKNGAVYPKWLTISAVQGDDGGVTHYIGSHIDITERKVAEEKIHQLAFHDPLTRLPNRQLLLDRLHQALASSSRSNRKGSLLFIDLDNFKTLNDTLGHAIGDLLLLQVAERLTSTVREGDTVARLGGDEFVMILEGLSEQTIEAAAQAEAVGEKVLAILGQPFLLDSHKYRITTSIGATVFSRDHYEAEELLKQADIAMYQAKKAGRNTLRFFDYQMQDTINIRAALESELHNALESRQFHLYY